MSSSRLHRPLLRWYDENRRKMPWREERSPYRTWLSEMMLQQTQVATVIPYFERFVKRFPDLRTLARASEPSVLKYWAGLGYYCRARNLLKAARAVVSEYAGEFPSSLEQLRALPGIGRYSAAAIASIAFGKPHELVDGNVIRVFSRLFEIRGDAKKPSTQEAVWMLAGEHLHRKRPGDWNQALMELGARVCVPESPLCGSCPVSSSCAAFEKGLQESLPETSAARKPVHVEWTACLLRENGRVLLWRRSEDERFLPGHWGLPERRHLQGVQTGALLRTIRHSITHHRITVSVREAKISHPLPSPAKWISTRELPSRLVSSVWRKAAGIPMSNGRGQ
ncbi:MAG: A/G-specific adenine glycosylase [Elusimicrobia bacterium CG_4_9_14_3_um_filter_62_55]|nr:MAG: A/G-specific adenine glycosylase [Elusimicrobia bacterium CG22_combo_CG10-13_8_21_14_all_63_91]PJA17372.1 MAG: A/G-specific adenine glycosylase [Elusimicrobia bacterium CG_4_10_14_0_2_um_filter_63_34]PJB23623.1 MAG: A/G-specific adenine glycosylase [Elusimicrobia bacterium CG_4_9_14_3_um_filter_62_55]